MYGPGIDEPLAIEQKGKVYFYHADGLGSIVSLTDHKAKVVQSYDYTAFGEMRHHGGKVKQPYTYTGREWDKETGLYFYRARYYDPYAGRFISKDPIGFAGGDVNVYGYVWNNPLNWVDPLGLYGKDVHYDKTYKWAIDAGYDPCEAKQIASADQGVDEGFLTNPLFPFNWLFGTPFHFQSRDYAEKVLEQAIQQKDLEQLGKFLHILQDSYSHKGYGFPFGHAFDGTKPDKYDPLTPRDRNMKNNTRFWLKEFRR